jgi:hypothetical protein
VNKLAILVALTGGALGLSWYGRRRYAAEFGADGDTQFGADVAAALTFPQSVYAGYLALTGQSAALATSSGTFSVSPKGP